MITYKTHVFDDLVHPLYRRITEFLNWVIEAMVKLLLSEKLHTKERQYLSGGKFLREQRNQSRTQIGSVSESIMILPQVNVENSHIKKTSLEVEQLDSTPQRKWGKTKPHHTMRKKTHNGIKIGTDMSTMNLGRNMRAKKHSIETTKRMKSLLREWKQKKKNVIETSSHPPTHGLTISDVKPCTRCLCSMFSLQGHDSMEKIDSDLYRCIECEFYHMNSLFFPKLFKLESDLNGSNGEWTNTDDIKSKKEINDDNKRNKKEAEKEKFKSLTQHKPDASQNQIPKTDKALPKEIECKNRSCLDPFCMFKHTKKDAPQIKGIYFGDPYSVIGVPMIYTQYGFGVLADEEELKHYVESPQVGRFTEDGFEPGAGDVFHFIEERYDEAFVRFGIEFPHGKFVFSPFIVREIEEKLPIPTNELRNYTAALRYVTKTYKYYSQNVKVNSVRMWASRQNSMTDRVGVHYSSALKSATDLYVGDVCAGAECMKVPEDISEPTVGWDFNVRWKIVKKKGVSFKVHKKKPNVITQPFRFDTLSEVGLDTTNSRYCSITPSIPFKYSAPSGLSCSSAISRYFKARPDEDELYRSNMGIVGEEVHEFNEFLHLCEGKAAEVSLRIPMNAEDQMEIDEFMELSAEKTRALLSGESSIKPIRAEFRSVHPGKRNDVIFYPDTQIQKLKDFMYRRTSLDWFERITNSIKDKGREVLIHTRNFVLENIQLPLHYLYSHVYHLLDRAELIRDMACLPSPKRDIYKRWVTDDDILSKVLDGEFKFTSKLKKDWTKMYKDDRFYATCDFHTLWDRVQAEILKKMFKTRVPMHEVLFDPNGKKFYTFKHEDTSNEGMTKLFRELDDYLQPGETVFVEMSDDSFLVERDIFGEIKFVEIDIVTCDASTGPGTMHFCHQMTTKMTSKHTADRIFAMLAKPTVISNPSNKEEFIEILPQTFFEYSGHPDTTFLNDTSSLTISYGIYQEYLENPSKSIVEKCLDGARRYGYIVTADVKATWNNITFLKNAYSRRCRRAYTVLGCLLRSLGFVPGTPTANTFGVENDIFVRMSETDRFRNLVKQRVDGLINEPPNLVLNALRSVVGYPPLKIEVGLEDLIERYGGNEASWAELENAIYGLKLGACLSCYQLDRIFTVDYGAASLYTV